ncbi:MAG: EamA family transporter, partial [Gammaproteobacteria bacterium]|nr:EamA family transporter [Gammaproteobacteria bacterium]
TALLVLTLSVFMHVAWNLMTRRAEPDSRFLWWALSAYLVLVGPWSVAALVMRADWSWSFAGLLGLTSFAEAVYFVALGSAYRHAPVPVVYPIARSSPVLIAIWSALLFGERLPLYGWLGIVLSVGGVLALAWTARAGLTARAVPWALLAALATSVYSTSNKSAVAAMPDYVVELGYVSIAILAAWFALTFENWRTHGHWRPRQMPTRRTWVLGGLFIGNAYALTIHAMQFIPAAYAVAFTNAGIVLAGVIAMTVYGEREHWQQRLAAMLAICIGLSVMAGRG